MSGEQFEDKMQRIGNKMQRAGDKMQKASGEMFKAAVALLIITIGINFIFGGKARPKENSPDFSQQGVTTSTVRTVAKDVSSIQQNLTKVKVLDYAPTPEVSKDKIVHVYHKPSVWDEEHAMTTAVKTSVDAMKTLFKNPKVAEVIMWQQGEFTDKYGETSTETAIRISMKKQTADKIKSWKEVKERGIVDYKTFFDLAKLEYIHPAIEKELQ